MDDKMRKHLTMRLVERLDRAVAGDSRDTIIERYVPVLRSMSDSELGGVWECASSFTDAQLYMLDEIIYLHIQKRHKSPRIGSDVHLIFQSTFRSPKIQ